jgi:hypothetical protein
MLTGFITINYIFLGSILIVDLIIGLFSQIFINKEKKIIQKSIDVDEFVAKIVYYSEQNKEEKPKRKYIKKSKLNIDEN